jgi:asparagine synthase (glutamine-hydrolysing)
MCGITGFLRPQADTDADALARIADSMSLSLAHRGPDDAGTWVDAETGVALGHRRLSIIDLSPTGHQPMVSSDGRWVLAYNGELYNTDELRQVLVGKGVQLRGTSDTEVLVESFALFGVVETLRRADGMFALGVWDRQRRVLSLARDRVGEKPLYWGWQGTILLFGSELKALVGHPDFRGEIDRSAAASMLRYGYVPTPWSIYRGIGKLEPGTVLEVDPSAPGRERSTAFWSFREVAEGQRRPGRSDQEVVDELDVLLRRAVRSRMAADVPLGAFLSGGIDSSIVVALMQAQSVTPVQTFTIGFNETGYDEAVHAKAVASHLGTDHTELYVTPADALAVVPKLPEMYDEPFADSSQIPTHLVSELAGRRVKVALSGDGGDELFGGYTRYLFHRRLWGTIGRVPAPARAVGARVIRGVPSARWDALARALGPALPASVPRARLGEKLHKGAAMLAARDPEQVYRPLLSHWSDPSSVVLGASEHRDAAVDPSRWASLTDATERMMFLDSISYLPDDILVKVDRAAMATSLETRVPLLAPEVVGFAWSLPLGDKIRAGDGKWPLRQVLHRYVPRELVERPKMGFGVPVGEWVRGPLRDWAEDLLNPASLAAGGLLDPSVVARTWQEHKTRERDWSYPVWNVLMLMAWQREAGRGALTTTGETHA